ncbi:MAG: zinc metalloprotease HtpX [Candidatus Bathyarchaeota archaeon]|nr:zinc metalloprotease HtpX [Candidatus Bathyarchaeota archaeon]MDH5713814.1 zinc metalloprotease HtpX [Candidatus Bathyarchaeota archaeon]
MSIWKLRFSVIGTLAVIIGISTLFFTILLTLTQAFNLITLVIFVVIFNIAQWLFAPYLIDLIYRARIVKKSENPKLYGIVEMLSQKSGIKMPRLMIANIPVPNAFAYGSPIAGTRVAVTKGLLEKLEDEEVEAVIGHELGHLKHRDVQVMMFVSLLPAIFYFIGYSMILSSMFGRRDERGSSGAAIIIGMASMLVYWILYIFTLYLSRVREYYADRHSATIVEDGPRKLSEGLAKIVRSSGRMKRASRQTSNFSSFKSLFIADPDRAELDTVAIGQAKAFTADRKLVEEVLRRKVTTLDRIAEILSSHPNIVKRLRALQELA